jgi:hypothetical protein
VHTASDSVAKEYGQGVPAFRVCVNTSAVHGSIGYSTNLFPAMTLGCGALGGNITSDNIGPHHLMNIKRIAWESRGIEHRTIPAERRMLAESAAAEGEGFSRPSSAFATAAPSSAAAAAPAAAPAPPSSAASPAPNPQSMAPSSVIAAPDRATISKIVERVMGQFGIPRGVGQASTPVPAASTLTPSTSTAAAATGNSSPAPNPLPSPKDVASAAVASLLGPRSASATVPSAATASPSPSASPQPPGPDVQFVSETDVRNAIRRGEKIFISAKTIVTPSARDLASSHEILIESK